MELLIAALSATTEGLFIISVQQDDAPSKIVFVNKGFSDITGYSVESLMGRELNLLQHLTSNTDTTPEEINAAIYSGKSIQYIKKSYTQDGNFFWSELSISPIMNDAGVPSHIVGVLHNVTARIHEQEKQNALLEQQNKQLDELAYQDFLTQLYNRRFFDRELTRLCAFHQRYQLPLSVAFFDIDYFKEYNDFYGHSKGDKTLRVVAAEIKQHFSRQTDITARYGGEEFVVLSTSNSSEEFFANHVEALRLKIEKLGIPHQRSKLNGVVTVSAGIYVGIPLRNRSPNHFTEEADHAMYQAKRLGRNRVAISQDNTSHIQDGRAALMYGKS